MAQRLNVFGHNNNWRDDAQFSDDGTYRYTLDRVVRVTGHRRCAFIMLNPSVAGATTNDPTITRVLNFVRGWGFSQYRTINLFALVSTDPKQLHSHNAPIGALNDKIISDTCRWASLIVLAWGNNGAYKDRDKEVLDLVYNNAGGEVMCFGTTKQGHPKHPLYLPNDAELIDYG